MPRYYPNARTEIVEGAKHMWRDKSLCALHYDRFKRGVDMNAPIRPAPSPIKLIMKDENNNGDLANENTQD